MRRVVSSLMLIGACLGLLLGASCPTSKPVVVPSALADQLADLLAINDPVKAEDAFFAVAKRVRDQSGRVDMYLVDQFRESMRDTWRGLELWRGTGDPTQYRLHWPVMLQRALVVEAAARGGK